MSPETVSPRYVELACTTAYSFLHGASAPGDMVRHAVALGHDGIGIADRNTVSGVVRAKIAIDELREQGLLPDGFRLVTGARLVFADDTPDIIAYPATRHGWGRLTRLLSRGNLRAEKGACELYLCDLIEFIDDLLLIAMPGASRLLLQRLSFHAPGRIWLGAVMNRTSRDARRLAGAWQLAREAQVPLIALNDALYAAPEDRPLQDVMTAIRLHKTVQEAGRDLLANAERHLKPREDMRRLFAPCPDALLQVGVLFERIGFRLEDLRYEYPHEPVPYGWEAQDWLEHLVMEAAHARYGDVLPEEVQRRIDEEFALIRKCNYPHYFLTVHDIVRYARQCEPPILCQGRGSAANSIVCFLLGVTSVDPAKHKLLFTRFLSDNRGEPPDIDVDFEHERREDVIQYMYKRYGRERAGIAATVIHYRARSAVREVGKALGLSEDMTSRMSSTIWGSYASTYERERVLESGFDPDSPDIARLNHFVQRILNLPRHLSQHVGGFVLTQGRLDEMVPIHNAAMEDRTFIEWDKDDIDALGLMKVDVLALGMLTCLAKGYALMRKHGLGDHTLETDLESEDPAVYGMLQRGDSIGVFQVESRAQINMLPRLKPKTLYDLVVQVAIVRPGPIEGDMVHPYLRRRCGDETVDYPSPAPPHDPNELRELLGNTYGVPLFQEQAMKLAITAAGFSNKDANGLRKAMATFRNAGTIHHYRDKMVNGMVGRGYRQDFAERCFRQIEGFGSYGFPESHAQSFARLVYVSARMKCHHPAVFACALLNSQPMGFYAPAQLVRDAAEHGVEIRPIDVNASGWDNGLESSLDATSHLEGGRLGKSSHLALRLGFRQIGGFSDDWGERIEAARKNGPFTSVENLARRAGLPSRALHLLADADACRSLGQDRRRALWEVRRTPTDELPLFAAARARESGASELGREPAIDLKAMTLGEHVAADYQTHRLSLKAHPMRLLRPFFDAEGVTPSIGLKTAKNGAHVRVGGVVLVRQRPGKGNAIFITLEDEDAICNVLLWARTFERYRLPVMSARLMIVDGALQRSKEGVIHVMGTRVLDRTDLLARLSDAHEPRTTLSRADVFLNPANPRHAAAPRQSAPRLHQHPRNVRLLPNSRDFH
ncbi:MAG: error-prone DNA polymerase [Sphingobium sp.]|nr:error-prone DNA polymerase [Sphingobium sp.]